VVEEIKLPPGWLAKDAARASERAKQITAGVAATNLAREIADVVKKSDASHNDKFTALTACIAALGAP
jgi:hypothetical protein